MTIPYTTYKILLKMDPSLLNVRTKTMKLLGKKQEKNFMALDLAMDY